MATSSSILRTCVILATCSWIASAQTNVPFTPKNPVSIPPAVQPVPSSWLDLIWSFPLFGLGWLGMQMPEAPVTAFAPPPPPCSIAPLPEIQDQEALEFEANVGLPSVVDLDGLTPATSRALNRFQNAVAMAGGTIVLTSAFRPSAYQDHLQAVWDKQMRLRSNYEPGCMELKAAVDEEFTRHELLVTQRPVPVSDHTLGIGFDAAIAMPPRARLKRRRVTLDSLARLAGVQRPAVRSDPVHFRLIGGRS